MAEINIIKFDGKPIEKLIDVISKGIGTIYRPIAIRKEADAKAYKIEQIERTKSKVLSEGREIEADTFERIQDRLFSKESNRQHNIDTVASIAVELLKDVQTISEEPVNEDWSTRYFNIVEDISDNEMQSLWGRILAGEVRQPKSYSLRTLELLKNLSKVEAEVFTKFANLKIVSGDNNVIYYQDNGAFLQSEFGITYKDKLLLVELGLIASDNSEFSLPETNQLAQSSNLLIGNKGIFLNRGINTPKQSIKVLVFTKTGSELSKLIEPISNENYIKKICSSFKHPNVNIAYGDIIISPNEQIIMNKIVAYTE